MRRTQEGHLDHLDSARFVVDTLASRLGSDIILLDLSGLTIIADYFVIASAESERQLNALSEYLCTQMKKERTLAPLAVEGTARSGWILLDYGSIVVHLFSEAQRERYQLEELWQDARTVIRVA